MQSRHVRHIVAGLFVALLSVGSAACLQDLLNQFSPSSSTNKSNNTTSGFRVTNVIAGVDTSSQSGTCPRRFTFTGTITVSEAGTVTYKWERSDGSATPTETMTFAGASSQTAVNAWDVSTSGSSWQRLRILTPNETYSAQANITVSCSQ